MKFRRTSPRARARPSHGARQPAAGRPWCRASSGVGLAADQPAVCMRRTCSKLQSFANTTSTTLNDRSRPWACKATNVASDQRQTDRSDAQRMWSAGCVARQQPRQGRRGTHNADCATAPARFSMAGTAGTEGGGGEPECAGRSGVPRVGRWNSNRMCAGQSRRPAITPPDRANGMGCQRCSGIAAACDLRHPPCESAVAPFDRARSSSHRKRGVGPSMAEGRLTCQATCRTVRQPEEPPAAAR